MPLATITEAIEDIRNGKMIVLVDDEDRENEGDLCMAAELVTPDQINFMAKFGRGLICLTMTPEKVSQLGLGMMTERNECQFETAFCVSIEAARGVTTGISAADRATTIRAAVNPKAVPSDLVKPGHVFPIRAKKGGVLVRTGQTEGSVDLARLAGLDPSGVICEIMKDDGTMARMPDLEIFAQEHGLKIVTIADLIAYRIRKRVFCPRRGRGRPAHQVRPFQGRGLYQRPQPGRAPGPDQGRDQGGRGYPGQGPFLLPDRRCHGAPCAATAATSLPRPWTGSSARAGAFCST